MVDEEGLSLPDDLARYNSERWDALASAGIEYTRPLLDLTPASARRRLDPHGVMGEVAGREVLCLASGGGQQSAAFGLLGAHVTVFDLSAVQLQRDREAAGHYGLDIRTLQGDMRDLSVFQPAAFDLVWQAHSINFVPQAAPVFAQVARVLRPGGLYRVECANPFVQGIEATDWDGHGYPISRPYEDGELIYPDPHWEFADGEGNPKRVEGPREFRHTLGTLVNGLLASGFSLLGLWEMVGQDAAAAPGTWEHYTRFAPPWITFWARRNPGQEDSDDDL